MSAALLLVTHEHLAHHLLTTAHNILDHSIDNIGVIEVPMDAPTETIKHQANEKCAQLDTDSGLLILTDLVGSTPYNLATSIKNDYSNAILISGLNLPMLLKIANYRNLPLKEISNKAMIGGQTGIDKYE